MIAQIKAMFQKKFPRVLSDEWLACSAMGEKYCREHNSLFFKYFENGDKGSYVNYSVGDLIPVLEDGREVAHYKVMDYKKEGGDLAMWDDGRKYELRLHSIV